MSQRPVPLVADRLQSAWRELNDRFFRSALPPIEIAWSWRLTASTGMFISRVGPCARTAPRQRAGTGRRSIRLSVPLLQDQSEQEIIRTLAHEMIHQWQYDVLKRRPTHGPDFHRMKDILNHEGCGVTVRHGLERAVLSFSRYTWQCLNCGTAYHRQRCTIRPAVHRCGTCRGLLREISSIPARPERGTTRAGVPTTRRIKERAGAVRQLKLPY